ncbi:hypothetical protein KSP40_PGU008886 [Platanthera guangdongensis]|uniref:Uncharacterized protein n=1 Tax=Platanthera guangdongensis TaxID=2320717 RepID=A0ABR2M0J6_9ASPA
MRGTRRRWVWWLRVGVPSKKLIESSITPSPTIPVSSLCLGGAALLAEAANMGDADAQYELGCRLRVDNQYVKSDQQAFYYIEEAVDHLHPGALYLLGAVYLTGDCVKRDVASAMWCFHRASEKGHAGAAIAYGSLLLKGYEVPEAIAKFNSNRSPSIGWAKRKQAKGQQQDAVEMAKEQFRIAADAGCDLGLHWLNRLPDSDQHQLLSAT